jgi:enoyl-CoA hydratase
MEEVMAKVDDLLLCDEIVGAGGSLGLMTLNRPLALNALTVDMCIAIEKKLAEWEQVSHIKAVVIRGEGEKAFCAGGDIRYVYDLGKLRIRKSCKFFWHEYRLNRRIFHFPKPYIALMHGITMGGGAGVSVHGSHRVGSETLSFAMPEAELGFFPDAGGSYFLPRCTGKTGAYIALTGTRLHIADALYAGLVDHFVPKDKFDSLIAALAEAKFCEDANVQVSDIIGLFSMEVDNMDMYKSHLLEHRTEINHCFSANTVEESMDALVELKSDWSEMVIARLLKKSPTSLKVALKQLLLGSQMDFDDCMRMEYRIAQHFLVYPDFYEGIRAAIIDKDHSPIWYRDSLEALNEDVINQFFEPLQQDLSF